MRRRRWPMQKLVKKSKPQTSGWATKSEKLAERPADAAPAVAYAATGEELKTAIERLAAKIEQLAERPADAAPAVAYAATGEELKTAIERLAAKIEQLAERPADAAPAV